MKTWVTSSLGCSVLRQASWPHIHLSALQNGNSIGRASHSSGNLVEEADYQ